MKPAISDQCSAAAHRQQDFEVGHPERKQRTILRPSWVGLIRKTQTSRCSDEATHYMSSQCCLQRFGLGFLAKTGSLLPPLPPPLNSERLCDHDAPGLHILHDFSKACCTDCDSSRRNASKYSHQAHCCCWTLPSRYELHGE